MAEGSSNPQELKTPELVEVSPGYGVKGDIVHIELTLFEWLDLDFIVPDILPCHGVGNDPASVSTNK